MFVSISADTAKDQLEVITSVGCHKTPHCMHRVHRTEIWRGEL